MPQPSQPPRGLFISYAHEDEALRDELLAHIALLERSGLVREWHDRRIAAGDDWRGAIDAYLNSASVIIFLVSADFLASDYCYDIEVTRALARANAGMARVIPIIVRPCDWMHAPFASLQALPRGAKPVTTWENRDEAWLDVARGIKNVLEDLRSPGAPPTTDAGGGGAGARPRPSGGGGRQPPSRAIADIFRTGGIPTFTYVPTEATARIEAELDVMGKGLLIEGPSGIGKTTAVLRSLQDLKKRFEHFVCGTTAADEQVNAVLARLDSADFKKVRGHIVIDDFHRLDAATKRRIALLVKRIADADRRNVKIVLIGINRVGFSLMSEVPDATGRIAVVKIGPQSDEKVRALIEQGEQAANIQFTHRSDFVEFSAGSFFTAQELCCQAAVAAGIRYALPTTTRVDVHPGEAARRVVEAYEPAFLSALIGFASWDARQARPGACLVLLWLLAKDDEGALVAEACSRYPELGLTFKWLESEELGRCLNETGIAALLYYDERARVLAAEDPKLRFYLRNMGWAPFARRAGHLIRITPDQQLEIVRLSPLEQSSPRGVATREPVAPEGSADLIGAEPADIGIVVALNEEMRELFDIIGRRPDPIRDHDSGQYTFFFDYGCRADGRPYRCAVSLIGRMGPSTAAVVTDRMLMSVRPSAIALVGIAGGIDRDLKVGDVIVASQIDEYLNRAKALPGADGGRDGFDLSPSGTVYRANHAIANAVAQLEFTHPEMLAQWTAACRIDLDTSVDADVRLRLLSEGLLRADAELRAEDIRLATGDVVAAAPAFVAWLRRRDRAVHAVEMEAGGVMLAAQRRIAEVPTLVVRGISDLADSRKQSLDGIGNGSLRRYAVRNAVRFLLLTLDLGLLPSRATASADIVLPNKGLQCARRSLEEEEAMS